MSIATAIQAAQGKVSAAYTKCNDKGATIPATQDLSNLADCIDSIQQGGGDWLLDAVTSWVDDYSTNIDLTKEQLNELSDRLTTHASQQPQYLFKFTRVQSADFSDFTNILLMDGFFYGSPLSRGVDFSNLVTGEFKNVFESTQLQTISFPLLTNGKMSGTFKNCYYLRRVDIPSIVSYGAAEMWDVFTNCSSLVEMTLNPIILKDWNNGIYYRPIQTATALTTIHFSAIAENDVYLIEQTQLNSASVLHILNNLSTAASGKTCAFGNITIPSSDENYAAISAKVAALTNWTITGLTL